MHFKVSREQLRKSLPSLKARQIAYEEDNNGDSVYYSNLFKSYIEQIEFAIYKTKLKDIYIDYEMAKQIRSYLIDEGK